MFYIQYLTMYKVHMHAGAIKKTIVSIYSLAKARGLSYRSDAQAIQ